MSHILLLQYFDLGSPLIIFPIPHRRHLLQINPISAILPLSSLLVNSKLIPLSFPFHHPLLLQITPSSCPLLSLMVQKLIVVAIGCILVWLLILILLLLHCIIIIPRVRRSQINRPIFIRRSRHLLLLIINRIQKPIRLILFELIANRQIQRTQLTTRESSRLIFQLQVL